jgi:hypothetical protein
MLRFGKHCFRALEEVKNVTGVAFVADKKITKSIQKWTVRVK